VINTDTHITNHFDYMKYGVSIARRGWLEKKSVLNALPDDELMTRLKEIRADKLKKQSKRGNSQGRQRKAS
jgi:hypothetical protein